MRDGLEVQVKGAFLMHQVLGLVSWKDQAPLMLADLARHGQLDSVSFVDVSVMAN